MAGTAGEGPEPSASNRGMAGMLGRIALLVLSGIGVAAIGALVFVRQFGEISEAPSPPPVSTQLPKQADQVDPAVSFQPARLEVLPGVKSVAPQTPWLKLDESAQLTRIGVGSCLSQRHPQPIWDGVLRLEPRPQLFLMIGDNVYGDIRSPDAKELVQAYRDQAVRPELARARQAIPFLATWDDHDYGGNDKGATFSQKVTSAKLFHDFWQLQPQRPFGKGIYYSRTFGPAGRRVQIIMLDTRSFRSNMAKKAKRLNQWGPYQPTYDPEATILGSAQWQWLEQELQEAADIRIIVSSVQALSGGHGFERWGNFPREKQRLFQLIDDTGATGTIMLSGDRHFGAFYIGKLNNGQTLPEMTASSLNRSYGPSKDAASPERISRMYNQENFGLVDIDWRLRRVSLKLQGMDGELLDSLTVKFSDLGIDR